MGALVFVEATGIGHDGLTVRLPGDVFQMPAGAKGSWFKPHGEAAVEESEVVDAPKQRGRPKKEAAVEESGGE